jgi:hypothetical protein
MPNPQANGVGVLTRYPNGTTQNGNISNGSRVVSRGHNEEENGIINGERATLESPSSVTNQIYNTSIRHGFAADYESDQYMSFLAEVCRT